MLKSSRRIVISSPDNLINGPIVKPIWKDWDLRHDSSPEKFLRLLTPGQRAFLLLLNLEEQVQDDGLYLYLWNSGNELPNAIKALRVVGATKYIPILGAARRIFRSSKIMTSRRMRHAELRKQQRGEIDERFHEVFDPLNARKKSSLQTHLQAYLRNHPQDFFLSREEEGEILAFTAAPIDYRIAKSKGVRLRGERLHWALIEGIWERYVAAHPKEFYRD